MGIHLQHPASQRSFAVLLITSYKNKYSTPLIDWNEEESHPASDMERPTGKEQAGPMALVGWIKDTMTTLPSIRTRLWR